MTKLRRRITSLIVGGVLGLSLIAPLGQFNAYAAPMNVTDTDYVAEAAFDEGYAADGEFGGDYLSGDEDNLNGGADINIVGDATTWQNSLDKAFTLKQGVTVSTSDADDINGDY